MIMSQVPSFTTGRKKIFCFEDSITQDNVIRVVQSALLVHQQNVQEIEWLFALFKGYDETIVNRERDGANTNINYKAFVSYYSLIAEYATNLFLQNPMVYVNADGEEHVSDGIRELTKVHRAINKFARDKTTVYHAEICGVAWRFSEPDKRHGIKDSVLSPTSAFALYGDDTDDNAMAKVYITQVKDEEKQALADITQQKGVANIPTKKRYTVYTDDWVFDFEDGDEEAKMIPAMPWGCPIVEYKLNPFYIGSFERVVTLIQMLGILRSDGVNGVVQSIAGLLLGKNIGLPMDLPEDTEEERKAKEEIREQFREMLRSYRQIWTNDTKDNVASLEYIATELYNADIDVLYKSILDDIITITRTPNSVVNMGGSGNAGATDTASGTKQALEWAKNKEPYWYESTREQTRIELDILHYQDKIQDLGIGDIDFAMQRSIELDPQTASQAYSTLIQAGAKPSDSARIARLTADPEAWEKRVMDWRVEEEERRLDYARREKEILSQGNQTEETIVTNDEA